MDSVDSSMRPSAALKMFGGTDTSKKRTNVSRKKSEQGNLPTSKNTPRHPSIAGLSREERIQLYSSRVGIGMSNDCPFGPNGRPLEVFTGEEYSVEEMRVENDINED